jgi:hypothetical protein
VILISFQFDSFQLPVTLLETSCCKQKFIFSSTNFFLIFSVEDWCQWHDRLPDANEGPEVAVAPDLLQAGLQELETRFHHLDTQTSHVSPSIFKTIDQFPIFKETDKETDMLA